MTCWQASLKQTLKRLQLERETAVRVAVVGIGHSLRGDDAAGSHIAQALRPGGHGRLLIVDAGNAPENVSGPLRRFEPDLVLLVDAVQMDTAPGTLRCEGWQAATGVSATTHTLPLTLLARYLQAQCTCEVLLLGIQPGQTALGAPMSPAVATAVDECAAGLGQILENLPVKLAKRPFTD